MTKQNHQNPTQAQSLEQSIKENAERRTTLIYYLTDLAFARLTACKLYHNLEDTVNHLEKPSEIIRIIFKSSSTVCESLTLAVKDTKL